MADGLSVAASVAASVSLGIEVTKGLPDYYEAYRSGKSDLSKTIKKLYTLLKLLKSLRKHVERKFRDDEQELLKEVEALMQNCKESILELKEVEESSSQVRGPSFRWPPSRDTNG